MAPSLGGREGTAERQTEKEGQDKPYQGRSRDEKSEDETKTRKGKDRDGRSWVVCVF